MAQPEITNEQIESAVLSAWERFGKWQTTYEPDFTPDTYKKTFDVKIILSLDAYVNLTMIDPVTGEGATIFLKDLPTFEHLILLPAKDNGCTVNEMRSQLLLQREGVTLADYTCPMLENPLFQLLLPKATQLVDSVVQQTLDSLEPETKEAIMKALGEELEQLTAQVKADEYAKGQQAQKYGNQYTYVPKQYGYPDQQQQQQQAYEQQQQAYEQQAYAQQAYEQQQAYAQQQQQAALGAGAGSQTVASMPQLPGRTYSYTPNIAQLSAQIAANYNNFNSMKAAVNSLNISNTTKASLIKRLEKQFGQDGGKRTTRHKKVKKQKRKTRRHA